MGDQVLAGSGRARGPASWRRTCRRLLLTIPLGLGAFAACNDDPCEGSTCVDESGMRLLDRVCASELEGGPACELSGAAEQTSAISADTIGFRLGDAGGSLTIHLQAVDAVSYASGAFDIEVLAVARNSGTTPMLTSTFTWGGCAQGCPPDPPEYTVGVPDEYAWIRVVSDQPTTASTLEYDATLTLAGAGIDIADIRSTTVYEPSCSIAGPIGSRR
ncbi:MAG: hypothetical protein IT372_07270 [Polyangiaceae bacterium]|nr:hypothetical protein [Polyangiaceae bacterium]